MERVLQNEKTVLHGDLTLSFPGNDILARFRKATLRWEEAGVGRFASAIPERFEGHSLPARHRASVALGPVELQATYHLPERRSHAAVRLNLRSPSPGPLVLNELTLTLSLTLTTGEALPASQIQWFRNGWQSWSFAGLVSADRPTIPRPRLRFAYRMKEEEGVDPSQSAMVSDLLTVVKMGDNAVLAGASCQSFFQRITIEVHDAEVLLHLTIDLGREPLGPGQELLAGGWEFEGARTATPLVRYWGERHTVARQTSPLVGWCSWYDRFRNISARYIMDTARLMASSPRLNSLRDLIVDDGYQDLVGDWLAPSSRFGAPITELARPIRQLGLRPGIWVAPFIAQSRSRLLRSHPDWLLRRNGRPLRIGFNPHWRDTFYPLDLTNAQVLTYLHELFSRLRAAGFAIFKLDYLFAAALPGDGQDRPGGRYGAFANALSVIRDAVGEESVLIGCGSPLAPAAGLVDAMRVSTDTGYSWLAPRAARWVTGDPELLGLYPAIRNTLARASFAGALYQVDPDCLLLRPRKGVDAASSGEAAMAASLAAHLGGVLLVGDDLRRWTEREEALLEQLLLDAGRHFQPFDSIDADPPVWGLFDHRQTTRAVTYNLGEDQEMFSLSLPRLSDRLHVRSARPVSGHRVDVNDERVSIWKIDRHSHAVVEVSSQAPPAPAEAAMEGSEHESAVD